MYNATAEAIEIVDRLFLPSVARNASSNRQLILIDDCSPLEHETRRLLEQHRPNLEAAFGECLCVRNETNFGFAGSYNRGIHMADGDVVLIVNDDVYFPRNSVDHLVGILDSQEDFGAAVPVTNYAASFQRTTLFQRLRDYSDEEIERVEAFAGWMRQVMHGIVLEVDHGMIGFCLAVRKSVLAEIGGFDTRFRYAMFEDTDLNRRILAAGRKVVLDTATFILHGGPNGGSMSLAQHPLRSARHFLINAWRYANKWGDYSELFVQSPKRIAQLLGMGTVTRYVKQEARRKNLWCGYQQIKQPRMAAKAAERL